MSLFNHGLGRHGYFSKSIFPRTTSQVTIFQVATSYTVRINSLYKATLSRAAVVHLNFRAGSTFPVPVCTVSPGNWVNKAGTQ